MTNSNTKIQDWALLLLRLVFGGAMLGAHGWGKLLRLFSGNEISFSDPFGIGPTASLALAVFAEVVCSALLVLGLFTRQAVLPLIVTMLVAFLYVHLDDPFTKMEKSVLYLTGYLVLWAFGPGWYSLDAQWRNRI